MADSSSQQPGLKRGLTLFAVVCLGLNGVIGQGIFLTPGKAADLMGPSAILALLLGAVLCFLIALCFAEVGSRFKATGGAYLYARKAFGDFVGFEVGWMTCCVAIISWATLSNGFTEVLAHFVPAANTGATQKAIACFVVTLLTGVNLFGVQSGARVVKFFTVAKLVPLAAFIAIGAFFIEGELFQPFTPNGVEPLAQTTIVLLYAYAGFETMVVPAGEMDNPQRSVPLALFLVLGICTVVYLSVFAVAAGTLPGLAGHANPVSASASLFMGETGGMLIALGIVLSVFGTNSGSALVNPRRFFALSERGDLPKFLSWTHPTTGAPVPAIVLTWAATIALTLIGSFKELLVIGVIARFAQYIPTCLAVLVLRAREKDSPKDAFRIPLGPTIPIIALILCVWLLANQQPAKLWAGATALAIGVPLYGLSRWQTWYDRFILPKVLDYGCRHPSIRQERENLLSEVSGTVLEIGAGSGLNFRHYNGSQIEKLVAIEPDGKLRSMASKSLPPNLKAEIADGRGEEIPLEDNSVDSVVITFMLCSVSSPLEILSEAHRVLKPGGKIYIAEHGLSPDADVAAWQHRLTPIWKRFSGGCHLNRDFIPHLKEAGFSIQTENQHYLDELPKFAAFVTSVSGVKKA